MRKQKSTLYLIAAALITLLAGACTDRSVPEPTPQEGVSLSFEQSEIEVDALGGEYSVYYTLTNGIDNINPVPQVNVSWIKDLRADDEMIYFTGDPIADLTEDMGAEQKARATYEHLMNMTGNEQILEPLYFLRELEVVHFQRFGEAMQLLQSK